MTVLGLVPPPTFHVGELVELDIERAYGYLGHPIATGTRGTIVAVDLTSPWPYAVRLIGETTLVDATAREISLARPMAAAA